MAVEIEALELEVVHKSTEASNAIDNLIGKLEKLRSVVSGGAGLKGLISEVGKFGKVASAANADRMVSSLSKVVSAAGNASTAMQEYVVWAKEAKALGVALPKFGGPSGASSASSATTNTNSGAGSPGKYFQDSSQNMEAVTESAQKAKEAVSEIGREAQIANPYVAALAQQLANLKNIQAQLSASGQTLGYEEYDRNAHTIATISAELKDYQRSLEGTQTAAKGAAQATKEVTKSAKESGNAAKGASTGLGKMFNSLKRIALYRLIRTALSEFVKALKDGITNLYYYSQAVNNTDTAQAANTMDAYASAILRVKNSIGAALMPIIQAALPLVQTLTNAIVNALNFFNKFVSALTGHSTYTYAAADATTSFASSLGGAAGAAKELRKQLNIMGFDELNIFEEHDSGGGGGGGGGGGSATPYNEMFETAPIEPEFLKKMKEWLSPITKAVERLKSAWDKFANSKLGKAVIDAFKFLGRLALSEAIERVGDAINYVADAIELITIIFDPKQFSLSKFFGLTGDMLETVGESASLPAYLGFSFANKALGNLFGKEDGLISDEWVRRIAEIATPGAAIGMLGEGFSWIGENVDSIGDWFKENVAPWFTKKRWQKLGTDAKAAFKKTFMWKAINAVSEWYSDKVQPWFTKEKWKSVGTNAISGFKSSFVWKMITAVSEWFQTKVSPWFTAEKWQGLGTKAINWFKGTFLWNKITSIATWYQTNVQPYFTKEKWQQISTNAVTWFKGTFLWDKVTNVATWYQNNVQPWFTKEKWQTAATNAVAWFKGTFVWTKITEIGTWFSTKVSPYFTRDKWRTFGSNAINWFRGSFSLDFDAIGTWFETKVKPWFTWQKWYNLGKDALNALVDGIKKIHIPTFHLEWGSVSWLNGTKLEWLKVPKLSFYAEGGYGIPNGQLFMANEAGPELVGQMNGRNTVANQGQIVEGIRQGVYDAVVSAFANNGGQSNHITIKVGDGTLADVVTRALNNQTRRLGYSQLEGI